MPLTGKGLGIEKLSHQVKRSDLASANIFIVGHELYSRLTNLKWYLC